MPNMSALIHRDIDSLISRRPYEQRSKERRNQLLEILKLVTTLHAENCLPYGKFLESQLLRVSDFKTLESMPFLPASIFKDVYLSSINETEKFREVRSSATSSDRSSRVVLDKLTNLRWLRSIQTMLIDRLGNKRFSLMLIEEEAALERSDTVSARSSMSKSMLFLASDVEHFLTQKASTGRASLDLEKVLGHLSNYDEKADIIIFGFTYILYKELLEQLEKEQIQFSLPNLKVIHAGGWKRLEEEKVSNEEFVAKCSKIFGIPGAGVVDLYGFSEQGGLLYPTCEAGARHTPAWSEIIVRDPVTLEPVPLGHEGMLQFLTPIQTSYPGHSLLTGDFGSILGVDECPCGRKGTTFTVIGRADTHVEVRGCGEIIASQYS